MGGSQEQLNNFKKPSLMARSNPIGLAEPSIKRDGYAVSKDGSFYRSSENMFENKPQKQVTVKTYGSFLNGMGSFSHQGLSKVDLSCTALHTCKRKLPYTCH